MTSLFKLLLISISISFIPTCFSDMILEHFLPENCEPKSNFDPIQSMCNTTWQFTDDFDKSNKKILGIIEVLNKNELILYVLCETLPPYNFRFIITCIHKSTIFYASDQLQPYFKIGMTTNQSWTGMPISVALYFINYKDDQYFIVCAINKIFPNRIYKISLYEGPIKANDVSKSCMKASTSAADFYKFSLIRDGTKVNVFLFVMLFVLFIFLIICIIIVIKTKN